MEFTGRVDSDDRTLADIYSRCLAESGPYAPLDEDFGMVPYEAFLAGKPVLTTTDAGGPLEVVADRETGIVVAPDSASLGARGRRLAEHAAEAAAWGLQGKAVAERVTWDACVDALLA